MKRHATLILLILGVVLSACQPSGDEPEACEAVRTHIQTLCPGTLFAQQASQSHGHEPQVCAHTLQNLEQKILPAGQEVKDAYCKAGNDVLTPEPCRGWTGSVCGACGDENAYCQQLRRVPLTEAGTCETESAALEAEVKTLREQNTQAQSEAIGAFCEGNANAALTQGACAELYASFCQGCLNSTNACGVGFTMPADAPPACAQAMSGFIEQLKDAREGLKPQLQALAVCQTVVETAASE